MAFVAVLAVTLAGSAAFDVAVVAAHFGCKAAAAAVASVCCVGETSVAAGGCCLTDAVVLVLSAAFFAVFPSRAF